MLVQSYRTSDEGNNQVNNNISHAEQNQQSQHNKTIYFLARANDAQHSMIHPRNFFKWNRKATNILIHPLY